jgi:hypothetical protein
MEVGDVKRVKPQALQTAFHRAKDPVSREIPFAPMRGGYREAAVIQSPCAFRRGHQHPSNLGREGVLLPRVGAQESPKPAFRKPQSIVRCGVEIADAASPRGVDRRGALLIGGDAAEVTELSASKADSGEGDAATDGHSFQV